ncbi:hypothetical protein [Nonomuraea wenchangensis]|uniref:Uncharacterized protein n=1 Tax=Nonomuraea wenchangensis TaxID=568860 RepID=A0A1I0EXY7_9ACTN|nr:hypothetical protein [Nonomuraea wenchangensis]SET50336.1 hypothetical protein SAMN05421811_103248 [Nonomuraea wenchangensis]
MTPAELIEKALREHLRLRLGKRALTDAMLDKPIMLSGREAEEGARIALDALAGAGLVVVSAEDLRAYLYRGSDLKREVEAMNRLRAALPEEG